MFFLVKIADLVQIPPEQFKVPSYTALVNNLDDKFANRVVQKIGLFIKVWDILWTSEGLIGQGDGYANVNVECRMVVFRPHLGEVLNARIATQSREGINLSVLFFNDIFVPWTELPDGSKFDPEQGVWVWIVDDQRMYFDNGEAARVSVLSEEWHDQTPAGPQQSQEEAEKKPPAYKITASMKDPGLGCTIWWDE